MRIGLGFKLGVLLAIFGILAAGLTGYYSYTTSRAMLVNSAEHDLQTSTQVLARRFSIALDEVAANARFLATLPDAVAAGKALLSPQAEPRRTELAQTFAGMLAVHPEYFQIRLISADNYGLELVRVDRDENQLTRVMAEDLQEKGHFPYVFKTLRYAQGAVYLSKITINHERGAHSGWGKPTLRVATPVFADQGKLLGLMVINLDLNALFDLLKKDLPADYGLYLTNEGGDYLIHPDPSQTFGFDRGRRVLLQDTFTDATAILDGRAETVVERVSGPDIPSGGLIAAFYKLPFGKTESQRFVVAGLSMPLAKILEDTRQLGANTLKIVAGFSLLAGLLATLASRVLTRPLDMMVTAARRFSREHVMSELPVRRADEIGQLARGFHDMQVEIQAHLEELHDSRRQLDHLARHDVLTGLPNRLLFFDRLEHAVAAARRSGKQLAVFFIDLDRFKEINDSLGHAAGNEVLKAVAHRLRSLVREVDTVARLGGDEFTILFESLDDTESLKMLADKIIQGLCQPIEIVGRQLQVSASIGASLFPKDAGNANELVHMADVAMYLAKSQGENVAHFHAEGEERMG
jgi:diguanylate cyclase (GGDEF)-like protein